MNRFQATLVVPGAFWAAAFLVAAFLAPTTLGQERLKFNRDIRPILSDNCYFCHGPDKSNRKGDLRLDVRDEAVAAGAIEPGKPAGGALIERITSADPEHRMPPPGSNKQLTDEQRELLRRWVAEGAEYEPHWAFAPLVKPAPPTLESPRGAVRNPIDLFVLDRLARADRGASAEASRETLVRRLALDLTGLPPTLDEVDEFLRDDAPDAYDRLVDRLLHSPRFGERMAVDWLDAARYADSNGYQVDRDRELWAWRDWVIGAFNANLPFDRFTIEQLAGDLLPEPTVAQRVATGFHRNHMLNEEGGVIADEFLAEYTADRVETTAAVWLGQTFQCARCHDHKYDPFTQRDFYGLKAFFHNVPEQGVGNYGAPIRRNAPPFLKLPTPQIEAQLTALRSELHDLESRRSTLVERLTGDTDAWARRIAAADADWKPLAPEVTSDSVPAAGVDAAEKTVDADASPSAPLVVRWPGRLGPGRVTALRIRCEAVGESTEIRWDLLRVEVAGASRLRPAVHADSLAEADVARLLDGARKTPVTVKRAAGATTAAVVVFEKPLELPAAVALKIELGCAATTGVSRWRVDAYGGDVELLAPAAELGAARKEPSERSEDERRRLRELQQARSVEHRDLAAQMEARKKRIAETEEATPTTLVMEEMAKPRATHVLLRGAYDKPGEAVTAATPAVLPPMPADLPRNRLGLARWLTGPDNPLVARVVVNRFWQACFGVGLVRTSEDFGAQGEPPSHPELLDRLAAEFRDEGWDVKRLVRSIVLSGTYRQRSQASAELRRFDPENRLLSRGPRFRLQAEFLRDQALAASGLLTATIGGPSVKPYHPPGLYEQVTAGSGYNVYVIGQGEALRRRSLYTYWKRSVPPPAMLLFDAPFRETCTLRRSRSNTPLQALNLLNDPTYVEASRFLAQRMLQEAGPSVDARLVHGFRLLLTRAPSDAELGRLQAAYRRAYADYASDPQAAAALATVGQGRTEATLAPIELAAFSTIAATLLNLDECLTKE